MNRLQKIDLVLRGLYQHTRNGTMLGLNPYLDSYNENMPDEEVKEIVLAIKAFGYGVYQVGINGYRMQITAPGVQFVETSSMSQPGTSVLNL